MRKNVFTLIELLMVIGILVSLLLPGLARAREMARRAVCGSNLKQTNMMLGDYADDHDE